MGKPTGKPMGKPPRANPASCMLLLPAGGFAQQCGLTMNLALEKNLVNNILPRELFVQTVPCWANLQAHYYILTERGFAHRGLPIGLPLGLPVGLRAALPHEASPHPKRWRRQRRLRPSRVLGGGRDGGAAAAARSSDGCSGAAIWSPPAAIWSLLPTIRSPPPGIWS